MSRRFSTRLLSRSASSSMVCKQDRVSSGPKVSWSERRLDDAALIEASGVRRSWLTAASRADRSWLARARESASAASACRRSLSRAVASWAAKADRISRSSAVRPGPRRARTSRRSAAGPGWRGRAFRGVARRWPPGPGRHRSPLGGRGRSARGRSGVGPEHGGRRRAGRPPPAPPAGRAGGCPRGHHPPGHPGQHLGVGSGLDGRGRRRADRSTSTLTTPAVTRNMTRARMSRVSAMVKVWMGGAK
jgi:hypothetical protein